MFNKATLALLAAVSLCAQAELGIADEVPRLDVSRTCRAEGSADPNNAAVATCMADEQNARDQLVRDWEQFARDTKTSCSVEATDVAGIQSYVELLTCLQIARDAGKLPNE